MSIRIGRPAPDFAAQAYRRGADGPVDLALTDYRGRWIVLFFYPADFTFICPTELRNFASLQEDFETLGADLVAASTDGYWTHHAWFEGDHGLESVEFPVVADRSQQLAAAYDVLDDDGTAMRGTFVIDDLGVLRHAGFNDGSVGRSGEEVLRILSALQTGELCPAGWQPGLATLGLAA